MMGAAVNAAEILIVTIESRGNMRRTAARIGVVAALALSMGVAAVNAARDVTAMITVMNLWTA